MLTKTFESNINDWQRGPLVNSASVTYTESNIYTDLQKVSFRVYPTGIQYLTIDFSSVDACIEISRQLKTQIEGLKEHNQAHKILISFDRKSQQQIQSVFELLAENHENFFEIKNFFLTEISKYSKSETSYDTEDIAATAVAKM